VKFLEHLLISIIWVGVISAGCWAVAVYAIPTMWRGIEAGQQAIVTARAQAGALASDAVSANRSQRSCTDEIKASMAAGAAIAKAAQPQPVPAGEPRKMVTAADLSAITGVPVQ
jgi:hypothetical protein